MDRLLITGATLLLILEISLLLIGLDEPPSWLQSSSGQSSVTRIIGEVQKTQNQVRRRSQNSLVWNESLSSEKVHAYDSVLTLAGSEARLRLEGDTMLSLDENTLVVLEPNDGESDSTLKIRFSRGTVRSSNPANPLLLENETWTLSAEKGSDLSLVSLEDGKFTVELESGKANLKTQNAEVSINHGEKLLVNEGRVEARQKISEEFTWSKELPRRIYAKKFPVDFKLEWTGSPQKLTATHPSKTVTAQDLKQSNSETVSLVEGTYRFALEKDQDTSASFVVQVRPAPQIQSLSPLPRDRVRMGDEVSFNWDPIEVAAQYKVEISRTPGFETLSSEAEGANPPLKIRMSQSGSYYWRIVATDDFGIQLPPREGIPLYVVPKPLSSPQLHAPELRSPAKAREELEPRDGASLLWTLFFAKAHAQEESLEAVFSWNPVEGADHYVIEISKTPGFEAPVIVRRVKKTSYVWRGFEKGRYFWRVAGGQSIAGEDQLGLFSQVAVAQLINSQSDAGEGVTVMAAANDQERRPEIDLKIPVATPAPTPSPTPTQNQAAVGAVATPESTPKNEEPPTISYQERTNRRIGRVSFRPYFRVGQTANERNIEGNYKGPVLVSFATEFYTKMNSVGRWEWSSSFDYTTWKTGNPDVVSPHTQELRWRTDLMFRRQGANWTVGLGLESLPILARVSSDEARTENILLYGVTSRVSRPLGGGELDLDFALRTGGSMYGARVLTGWSIQAGSHRDLGWALGPWISYEYFDGTSRRSRDARLGLSLDFGW